MAVGGHAGRLAIHGSELALTYSDLRALTALPAAAAVMGAADTGCQIAPSPWPDLGTRVSLFEASPAIVPNADPDISVDLERAFQRRGIETHTNTMVNSIRSRQDRLLVEHAHIVRRVTETLVDAVFFAVGWPPNIEQLALEAAGIHTRNHKESQSTPTCAPTSTTSSPQATSTADPCWSRWPASKAASPAENALLGPTRRVSYDVVPSASFTDPEYGGSASPSLAARRHDIAVGIARYDDLLRPVADGHEEGFCKLIADRNDTTILGAHVLGEYSAEIIQVVVACMAARMTVEQAAELPFAFPTFTEGITMAAQKICSELDIGRFPPVWSYLGPDE